MLACARNVLGFAVEVKPVLGEGAGTGDGGVCAEVRLGERDRKGGVCGEVQFCVAFAPISVGRMLVIDAVLFGRRYGGVWNAGEGGLLDDCNIDGGGSARGIDLEVVGHIVGILLLCEYLSGVGGGGGWRFCTSTKSTVIEVRA